MDRAEKKYTARLKFYADTPKGEKNKYFCWEIGSILDCKKRIVFFLLKGWQIRAAWFENIDKATGEIIENSRLNVEGIIEELAYGKQKTVRYKSKYLH